jgi:hypothetical protein
MGPGARHRASQRTYNATESLIYLYFSRVFPVRTAAGELLHVAEPFLEKNLHPTVIVKGYAKVRC